MIQPETSAQTNTSLDRCIEDTRARVWANVLNYRKKMNFEEFENLARLYVVGALEDGEEEAFQEARQDFGDRAERLIAEFRQLNSVFALSLCPHPPHPDTKRKLLQAIREAMHGGGRPDGDSLTNHGHSQAAGGIPD